jgi:hypothetical protein
MKRLIFSLALLAASGCWAQGGVPRPEEVLGFAPGADRKLADWGQIVDYYEKLAVASPRVAVTELGKSTQGNPLIMAVISSPENLSNLERYRGIQDRLADPRKPHEWVVDLVRNGKVVVLVTCGIHSTEVASPLTSLELAYELASSGDPETAEILENVIVLLVPSLNPDGTGIVTKWYRGTVGTPAEGLPPPELYHVYSGHDNNRDWFMFTQKETRLLIEKVYHVWHPQIVVDLHQMGPYGARLFVPPFIDPIDPNVDPILQAGITELGGSMFAGLVREGKTGVVINAIFDAYTPARSYQHYHGGVRILIEAAGAKLATPIHVDRDQLVGGAGYDPTIKSWNFPAPWHPGLWRLADIISYQESALRLCLLHAARSRASWLQGFRQVLLNALNRETPYAFVIPGAQADSQAVVDLLEIMRLGEVDTFRAERAFKAPGRLVSPPYGQAELSAFPEGSLIIPMRQPYSAFAKTLLEASDYRMPARSEEQTPYDVTAHNLGAQLGLAVYQVDEPWAATVSRIGDKPFKEYQRVTGRGEYVLFSHDNSAFARLSNRLLEEGVRLSWAPSGFESEGGGYPAGTIMARYPGEDSALEKELGSLPISVARVRRAPLVAWQAFRQPRVAVYRDYSASPDEGWTRWVLEQNGFPYVSLSGEALVNDDLSRYDAIVLPSQDPASIVEGLSEPYPEKYRGGIGAAGLERLKQYAQGGGLVALLGRATELAERLNVGVEDAGASLGRGELLVPGALLRVGVNNRHPIGYGAPEQAAVMFEEGHFFSLTRGIAIARYADKDLLVDGWARGEERMAGACALAEVPWGRGAFVFIGFRPQFRAQTRASFKFLFNSLFFATTLGN